MTDEKPFFRQLDDVDAIVAQANEPDPQPVDEPREQDPRTKARPRAEVPPTERTIVNRARENRIIT